MRNRLLAVAAIAGAMAAPIAAQAQSAITTGVVGGSTVVVGEHEGITDRPAAGLPRIRRARTRAELHDLRIASSSAACCRKPA